MRYLLSSFLFCLVGCGAIADDGQTPSGGPKDPNDPTVIGHTNPNEVAIEGSFDLTFTQVTPTSQGGQTPPSAESPSLSTSARLDISTSGGTFAQITGRWGQTGTFAVSITDTAVTLAGTFSIGGQGAGGYVSDQWKTLVLERGASGGLTGKITAEGEQTIGLGDVLWESKLSGSGTFVRDQTRPALRLSGRSSIGPVGEPLPWERFTVQAAEPVSAVHVQEQSHVEGPDGDSLQIRWNATAPGHSPFSTQAVSFVGTVDDWTRAGSGEPWNITNAGTLVNDMVGLTSDSLYTTLPFARIGAATTEVGFDDDILEVDPWGTSSFLQSDARCENGGCLALGPTSVSWCAPVRNGFAGRLTRGTTGHVSLRYRVLAKSGVVFTDLLTLELAAQNGEILDTTQRPDLTELATPIGDYTHATDWTTLDVAAPAGGTEIGYAVITASPSVLNGGCGGPPPPSSDLLVLIESVKSL